MCKIEAYGPQHADGVVQVVRRVYDEYGFTWDAAGYHRDLYDVDGFYGEGRGAFWVLLASEQVVGCVGVRLEGDQSELHRMYLLPEYRGRGLGRLLLETAVDFARSSGARRIRAWSDVKLPLAHKLYHRFGFVQQGQRICDDPDQSREYGFWKDLT